MGPIWGIDLGGTKIEGVVLGDSKDGEVLRRIRVPTESYKGYQHVVNQISKLVEVLSVEIGMRPQQIGIGTPGTLDPMSNMMKNCNTTCLNGNPLKKDLEEKLRVQVKMANDANCFALAETRIGVIRDEMPEAKVVFGVIMGTGVGGGLVINGDVIGGRQGIAGEWGHNFLDESGGDCYCGKIGCVEQVLSGPSLEKFYRELSKEERSMQEILQRFEEGKDDDAHITIHRMLKYFGKGMSSIINILDPDAIILGGGLGNIDLLYTEGVRQVEKHVFNNRLETKFYKPKLGDSAGVFGAAFL